MNSSGRHRFVIGLDAGTADRRDAITNHLRARRWKVWHWFDDLWLLSGVPADVTPRVLWEELDAMPSVRGAFFLVLRIDDEMSYWGMANMDSWPWMRDNWGVPDHPPE